MLISPPLSARQKKSIICPVTNLSPEFCLKIKEARRAAKLSQSMLASEVGCKQSALSMFEQGDGTKLNDEVIRALAAKFDIPLELPETKEEESSTEARRFVAHSHEKGFCPNPHCPSNHKYDVDGRNFYQPDRSAADPVGGIYCAVCGEVLERKCPNCGAPLHDGAVCSFCGEPYIAAAQ